MTPKGAWCSCANPGLRSIECAHKMCVFDNVEHLLVACSIPFDTTPQAISIRQLLCPSSHIVGFIRFTKGYYLVMITNRRKAGNLGPHSVYEITATEMIAFDDSTKANTFSALSKDDEMRFFLPEQGRKQWRDTARTVQECSR